MNYFNVNYAWTRLLNWIANFRLLTIQDCLPIFVAGVVLFLVLRATKNIAIAVMFTVLGYIVYETYFNIPTEIQATVSHTKTLDKVNYVNLDKKS